MADYEIERERIIEREPHGRRVVVERAGPGPGMWAGSYMAPLIMAAVVILLLLLVLGAFT